MKDQLGNVLEEGDLVAYVPGKYGSKIKTAYVRALTAERVKLGTSMETELTFVLKPDSVVKVFCENNLVGYETTK